MFDSGLIIFLECVFVFIPLYYSMVAARWINNSTRAISVLTSARSPKKVSESRLKKLRIEHGDSVSSLPVAEIEQKVKERRHEVGDTNLLSSSRCNTSVTKM